MAEQQSVLIVDDQEENLFILEEIIKEFLPELTVLTAVGGEACLRKLVPSVGLVISDVQMPLMNGVELCRKIKADPLLAHIPVLLITAHQSSTALRVQGLEAGALDFISRPIDTAELVAKLRVALGLRGDFEQLSKQKADLESELELAETQYKTLFDFSANAVLIINPYERIINANEQAARMFGCEVNDLKGASLDMLVPSGSPSIPLETVKTSEIGTVETEFIRIDSSRIQVEVRTRTVDLGGSYVFLVIAHDITKRKMHERTTLAMYNVSKAISTTNNLQHLYENIHSILGEVINARNFSIALLAGGKARIAFSSIQDRECRGDCDVVFDTLMTYVTKAGKSCLFKGDAPPSTDVLGEIDPSSACFACWLGVPLSIKGKVLGAMAVLHNSDPRHYTEADVAFMQAVSEQVAMAIEHKINQEALTRFNEELESQVKQRTMELQTRTAELEEANLRLTELDEVKSGLVSSVSHELRTPLTSILGFAKLTGKDFCHCFLDLAQDEKTKRKGMRIQQNLEIIGSEGERLTRLINDFLDLNKIESGNAVWNDRLLDTRKIILQATSSLAGAFEAKEGVELIVKIPESLPPIHADPDKIQQLIINLLNNAYKFTEKGSVTIAAAFNSETLKVTVTDTGRGIPEDELSSVFEKFHKLSRKDDTITPSEKGTGLGLAISREIINNYGGSIWVDSHVGTGSAFTFTLPVVSST